MFKSSNRNNSRRLLVQSTWCIQAVSIGVLLTLSSCNSKPNQAGAPTSTANPQVQASPAEASPGSTTKAADSPTDMTVDPNSANILDNNLVAKGAQDNLFEIQAGQLAAQKAANADVKQFAQMIVRDHTKATNLLQQLATKRNISLPTEMGEQNQAVMARLSQLSGAEFDRAYMTEIVNSHQNDVALVRNQAQNGKDQELKALAAEKLPALEHHLSMAQNIARRLNS